VSMLYSFNEKDAAERHETQYFEMIGNRGIYHKGWTAVTRHRTPWKTGAVQLPAFDDDVWELYDTNNDWSQARDLAQEQPEKLKDLQRLWLIEATKYNVLPLDDRFAERASATLAGRPQLAKGKRQLLFGGMGRLSEGHSPFYPDRRHLHHRLLRTGLSHRRTVLLIYAFTQWLGSLALVLVNAELRFLWLALATAVLIWVLVSTRRALQQPAATREL